MVEKKGNKWCVVHGHEQKGSATDKPIGTVIKCYEFIPGNMRSEQVAKLKAEEMHKAILISETK
jgi:hypothetical protein